MEKLLQIKDWFIDLEKKWKIAIAVGVVIIIALIVGV